LSAAPPGSVYHRGKKKEQILLEAQKNVLEVNGIPTNLPNEINRVTRCPTNLAKVREVMQGPTEPPSVFLERLIEAYRHYTPFDQTSEGQQEAVAMAFIGQSASDIKRKLQKLERLHAMALQDLVREAEKVYHKRETEEKKEERENKRDRRQKRNLSRILAAVVGEHKGRNRPENR
jgi:AcrR family transcriptional regulator